MRIISVAKNILSQSSLMLATNEKWCIEHLLSWTIALMLNAHSGASFPYSQMSYKLILNLIKIYVFSLELWLLIYNSYVK